MFLAFHDILALSHPMDKTHFIWFAYSHTSYWEMDQSRGTEYIFFHWKKNHLGLADNMM